ncbi:MAG: ribosomal protein S18-alanine N-acetyltransferase [Elusimicrobia bacterium]|nr:ribosomal protein S18-alanine N-acetyltransferase [Elusimicrobiota bacterium]
MSASIRPACAADLDAVLEIEAAWPTTPHWPRRQFEAELSELGLKRSVFLVAEDDLAVAGYAAAWLVQDEVQILSIAVHGGMARRGVGRLLLDAVLEAAKAAGCRRATLDVSERNAPARGLYESSGFAAVGRRPGYYDDGSDALLMDKPLT